MPVIETPRLLLVPLPLDAAAAMVHGHRPPEANWAPDYPTDSTLVAASMILTADAEGHSLGPWTVYQVIRRDNGRAVGGCGFVTGPPDHAGHVHISFSIVESEHGNGFGAEAVRGLAAWAQAQPGVTRVVAETACTNAEAIRVYEDAGLRRTGSAGDLVFFAA